MSVSLYEQFLAVGSVKSLMTGKSVSDSCSGIKNTKEKREEGIQTEQDADSSQKEGVTDGVPDSRVSI